MFKIQLSMHSCKKIFMLLLPVLLMWQVTSASGEYPDDGTMLMFVGEDIELLSIASRREETPARAPAVARVITREEFRGRGQKTLSGVLQSEPGFHMVRKEWGHRPYLRGMPDSIMFLYDTVPLGSELSKSLHPIDHELSLAPVKQVEIVRGPSSVLWGADAFAGVVNVVPMSGRDLQGGEAGVVYGEPGFQRGAYLNLGRDFGTWDGFLSISAREGREDKRRANLVSFFDHEGSGPVPPDQRLGRKSAGDARYIDAYARLNLGSKVALSGRISESTNPFTVKDHSGRFRWVETHGLSSGFVKLDVNHELNLETRIRLSGHYSRMNPEHEIVDKKIRQKDETFFSEVLMDRSMYGGSGLLTAGLSYRNKKVEHTLYRDVYIPGFFSPDNVSFRPPLDRIEFSSSVLSPFVQYSHKFGDFDLMLGLRQDFNDQYKNNLSHNAALVWTPVPQWAFKLLYGTAYRTPFASQVIESKRPDMEKSENFSFQAIWTPSRSMTLSGTLFYNRLSNHVMGEVYIPGASFPNRQDLFGLELEMAWSPVERLDLDLGLALVENRGPDEKYRYVESTIIKPDGTIIYNWREAKHPFDAGPSAMFDMMGRWKATDRLNFYAHLEYFSSTRLIFVLEEGSQVKKVPEAWLTHAGIEYKDFMTSGLDLTLDFRNITNNRYKIPGSYRVIRDRGVSGELGLRYVF